FVEIHVTTRRISTPSIASTSTADGGTCAASIFRRSVRSNEETTVATQPGTPNILLCIADDLGEGSITITGTGAARAIEVHSININQVNIVGALPNVSRFLRNGLYFSQAWAQPACSPT